MGVLFTTAAGTAIKLSTVASIAGAAVGAAGAIRQGRAAQQSAQFNAEMLRRQEDRQRQINAINAKRKRKETEQLAASQRALMAGQGRDASSGSALLLQEDLAEEGELQSRMIENQGEAEVSSLQARRNLEVASGAGARKASYIRAGTTLLSAGKAFA